MKPKNTQAPATISRFEIDPALLDVRELAVGEARITVDAMSGPDAYRTFEVEVREGRPSIAAHRTVQRIDLATRLQLAADYEPLDLVGRTFLVEA